MHFHHSHNNNQPPFGQSIPGNMMHQQQPNQQPYFQPPPPPPLQQPQYQHSYPPAPAQNYQQAPHAHPPQNQYIAHATYYPRVGFTQLPPHFHIWNTMSRGGTSILNLGPQPNSAAAYSAKMGSSNCLMVHSGAYDSSLPSSAIPACNIDSKHMFSQKTTISFTNFSSPLKEVSMFQEGVSWPFEVEVNGSKQMWQWTRPKSGSTMKQIIGSLSQSKFGRWELVPASGGNGNPGAVFEPAGGNTLEKDSELGVFSFRGPAAEGEMGDVFMNVVIAVLLRIMSQHYIARLANLAS